MPTLWKDLIRIGFILMQAGTLVTYTNLDPGEYVFRVKGSNNDGIWNEAGTSIKIIILPPWWKTTWAYIFYILFIVSANLFHLESTA